MLAVGGTEKMHRTVLSSVLRGHGPGDAAAEVSMKKMLRNVEAVLDASGKRDNEKRGYAAHWWKNYLLLCDSHSDLDEVRTRSGSSCLRRVASRHVLFCAHELRADM